MQYQTSTRVLEITVISAEDLRGSNGRRAINKNTYVTLRTDPNNHCSTKINAKDEGGYPWWNEKINLELPSHATSIAVEVHCRTLHGNDTTVGKANIPVSDFTRVYTPVGYLNFLSYRLMNRNGGRNGIINLSVREKVPC